MEIFELEGVEVTGLLEFFLALLIGLVEFVEVLEKGKMFFLKLGEGRIFMGECGETIVVFVELPVGGFKLVDLLLEALVMVIPLLEKFLKEGDVWDETFLVFKEIV